MIDTHVHLDLEVAPERARSEQALRFALGVTTVRDASTLQFEALLEERGRARAADYPYPRIVATAEAAPPYDLRSGRPLGAPLVEYLAAMGADAIKIKGRVGDTLWPEVIRAARRLRLPVYGHTWRGPMQVFTRQAILEGLSGVSHLTAIAPDAQPPHVDMSTGWPPDQAGFWAWHKALWLTADQRALDDLIDLMSSRGVWLEPMLAYEYYWGIPLRPPPALAFLSETPPSLGDLILGRDPLSEPLPILFPEPYAQMAAFVKDFHDAGGFLVVAGDNKRPGLDVHEEIRLLREAGLTPQESLRAATAVAAEVLGRSDLGTVEPGKLADAVIYDADPLGAPGGTLRIRSVVKGGVVYDATELLRPFQESYAARVRALWWDRALRGTPALAVLLLAFVAVIWAGKRVRFAESTAR